MEHEEQGLPSGFSQRLLLQRILPWLRPQAKIFVLCLSLLLIGSGLRILGPIILQTAIDGYIRQGNFPGLLALLGGYICLILIGFGANYYELILLETAGQRIIAGIKNKAFSHLLNLDLPYFDQTSTGKLVSRIENDANAMKVLFTSVLTQILGNFVIVLGMFAVMGYKYDFQLALYVVGLCPLILLAAIGFNRFMAPRLMAVRKNVADVNGYVTEMIQGMVTIQMFGQEANVLKELEKRSLKKYKQDRAITILFNSFFNFLFLIQSIGIVMVLWLGGQQVRNGALTIGSLILFMNFIHQFFVPIMFLSAQFNEFQKGIAGAARLFELLDEPRLYPDPVQTLDLPTPERCQIRFENVWFRYSEESDWVLKDLSFDCPSGEHWAIVGPTGSGKTTLINLLLRFYLPQKGRILINGVDLKELDPGTWRRQVGLVLQDVVMFPGSVYENLVLGESDLPLAEIQPLLAEIGLDPVVQRLPEGYQTHLLENASNLSSGEKQLLSFGRALLRKPALLILDEATSHIDPQTERQMQNALHTLLEGRTALMIAHRLSTIQSADRILVLHYGTLVESGNHQELLAQDGVYAGLNALQKV
ncbi:MAG: ABC transporter ATP-binding protein [Candidatus Sericytochromatia bacterium]